MSKNTFKFGDVIDNGWASPTNPNKRAYFVTRIKPGLIKVTDGKGTFWNLESDGKEDKITLIKKSTLEPL